MHENSLRLMQSLLRRHAMPAVGKHVIDVGSQDVNGSYRQLVLDLGFAQYVGLDVSSGANVDFVVPEAGIWSFVPKADVVISGQCLEHVRRPWDWIRQINVLLDRGGFLIVIAPWRWDIHRHPVDCWRILPDGMESLFEHGKFEVIEIGVDHDDCFGVGRKQG